MIYRIPTKSVNYKDIIIFLSSSYQFRILLWRVTPHLVKDNYNYTNFWEIFLLPAQKNLIKDPKSLVRSKFGLIKKVFEAILLDTSYNFEIERIPEEIRAGLGITSAHDLFKLSPFSDNTVGILLDTSTLNGSVHRVFSFHFSSGLVSIPITDPNTGEIAERFEDYDILLEESKSEVILENIDNGNKKQYFQFLTLITKPQIRNLLYPGKGLLPIVALIVRFSDRWVTERNYLSYKFWEQFYSITTFYEYLLNWLITIDPDDLPINDTYQDVLDLIEICSTSFKKIIKELVWKYFFGSLSFSAFNNFTRT
ncbi:MAG: hypothetical protein ACFFAN_09975 [Promethearchaeota archaeon]